MASDQEFVDYMTSSPGRPVFYVFDTLARVCEGDIHRWNQFQLKSRIWVLELFIKLPASTLVQIFKIEAVERCARKFGDTTGLDYDTSRIVMAKAIDESPIDVINMIKMSICILNWVYHTHFTHVHTYVHHIYSAYKNMMSSPLREHQEDVGADVSELTAYMLQQCISQYREIFSQADWGFQSRMTAIIRLPDWFVNTMANGQVISIHSFREAMKQTKFDCPGHLYCFFYL